VKRQTTTVLSVVAMLLGGTACGGLASPSTDRPSDSEQTETRATTSSRATLDPAGDRNRAPAVHEEADAVVESVDFVPVDTAGSDSDGGVVSGATLPGAQPVDIDRLEPGVYDLSVRIDADALEGPVEEARLMMADAEEADGETSGGDPVPLPADGTAFDGETRGGDPVPLPADETSEQPDDGTDTTQPHILHVDDAVWLVFANLQLPPADIGLSVALSGPQGTAAMQLVR